MLKKMNRTSQTHETLLKRIIWYVIGVSEGEWIGDWAKNNDKNN